MHVCAVCFFPLLSVGEKAHGRRSATTICVCGVPAGETADRQQKEIQSIGPIFQLFLLRQLQLSAFSAAVQFQHGLSVRRPVLLLLWLRLPVFVLFFFKKNNNKLFSPTKTGIPTPLESWPGL
jgi:hypothetical protein